MVSTENGHPFYRLSSVSIPEDPSPPQLFRVDFGEKTGLKPSNPQLLKTYPVFKGYNTIGDVTLTRHSFSTFNVKFQIN